MKVLTIETQTLEVMKNEAIKTRQDMQKRGHNLNSQYYSGRIAVLRDLLDLPQGEVA